MKARLVKFGEIEVEGKRYTHDVVIDGGNVRKRKKGPSKQFREKFGHTPLSAGEEIPWGGKRLIVETGAHGALLFKKLATLRTDAPLFKRVETLRWRGATPAFAAWAERMKAPRLLERCEKAAGR
jgi:hypothetical protein